MPEKISPLINASELIKLKQKKEIVLIDARMVPAAREKYKTLHLAGAGYVDMEEDLSAKLKDPANGGRHPLPGLAEFSGLLQALGITPDSHIIVYDEKNGSNAAARFWWMMRAVGHEAVQVLDGGLHAAIDKGFATSSGDEPPITPSLYPISKWLLPLADINEVEKLSHDPDSLIIDVRSAERFRGETEPIDLIAGHIPGAINIPFTSNLDSDGFFLPASVLKEKYIEETTDLPGENLIIHCGSGVTACHTLLAMDYAGLGIAALYVGSWSEWSRTERPVATGNK